ncbi:hypothetical protein F5884DRAFT_746259 [Xylogone sp. PMI_703]|nr:hypothetical protein F5884DRAFT_746259 [Xylogone sp. PMI_703]
MWHSFSVVSYIRVGKVAGIYAFLSLVVFILIRLGHLSSSSSAGLISGEFGRHQQNGEFHQSGAAQRLFSSYNDYGVPIYVDLGQLSAPAFNANDSISWDPDPREPKSGLLTEVQPQHPRLFAPSYKWSRLPALVAADPYLASWNETIFERAAQFHGMEPVNYTMDGGPTGSGVLDIAREVQLRIKHWAYAYRMSNNTKWANRVWEEVVVASGNSTRYFGVPGDNWNSEHWLDVGEFIIAFAYAYDWLYNAWNTTQRDAIMWSIISLGLQKGIDAYDADMWFLSVNGNWNCEGFPGLNYFRDKGVVNAGMIIGSLAVYNEDPTGTASRLLATAVPNAQQNCAQAVHSCGAWTETPDYWYFGTQAHAQMASALLTATGNTQRMLTVNPATINTSLAHIYNWGMTQKFNYGDCGPAKYTASANALFFYADQYHVPRYALYQRDRPDAPDPVSMFWYNPQVTGGWFVDFPLDRSFPCDNDAWVSMRSTWTDPAGLFAAMKAGKPTGHQTHGHIDAGSFVLDALGERWAGELCQGDYLSTGYFSSEAQDSPRWLYYRCRTEGHNTIMYNNSNQIVDPYLASGPSSTHGEESEIKYAADQSTAYWIADLTNAYNGTVIKRGIRLLNRRKQVLIQDEITNATAKSQWRMHTNASITCSGDGRTAFLTLHGKFLNISIQSPTSSFRTLQPIRLASDPPLPEGEKDLSNPGVRVLAIDIPAGTHTVAVMFSPVWNATWLPLTPAPVPLEKWNLTSHGD